MPHYSFIILADIDVGIIYPLLENITNDIQVVSSYNESDSNFCIFLPLKVVLYVKQFRYWLLMLNSWRVAIRARDKERQLTMVCAQPGLMSRSAIFHKERSNNNKTSVWLLAFMTQIVPLLVEYCVRNFCLWEIFVHVQFSTHDNWSFISPWGLLSSTLSFWLLIFCGSSWKGRFGESSWHGINVSLIQKYKLKRTSWNDFLCALHKMLFSVKLR